MVGDKTKRGYLRTERLWGRRLAWYQLPLWAALTPGAAAYRLVLRARSMYWRGRSRHPGLLTISVGNLTVGGNGKTPFTLFLARRLRGLGLRVGIVSRGYGRRRRDAGALLVSDGERLLSTTDEAGDEPVMLARLFGGPVAVALRREDAIALLRQRSPVDAVVLDDAFQHIRLKRDVDLLVLNTERGLGNGWLLPAGPMREPMRASRRASAVVLIAPERAEATLAGLSRGQQRKLARTTVLRATLKSRSLVFPERDQWQERPTHLVMGQRVLALSGLADPSGFYRMLRELDAELVGVLEYPDHHHYTSADWQTIVTAARNADLVVTTEKDLVKLDRFPFERDSLCALRLEVQMEAEDEAALLKIVTAAGPVSRAAANA